MHSYRARRALRSVSLVIVGAATPALIAACGSAVPVTSRCATPGATSQTDSFNEQVPLTTAPSGLKYGDLRIGCGPLVQLNHTVTVEYTGWLGDGSLFDSSRRPGRQAFTFLVGANEVIPGFEDGLLGMHVGGKRRLVLPPRLGYGTRGRPPVIPPNSTLVFDVEVTKVS